MTQGEWVRTHVQTDKAPLSYNKFELKHSYIYDFDPKAMLSNAGL